MYNVYELLLVAGSSSAPLLDLVTEQVYILTVLGEHELIDREGKLELKGTVQVQQLRGSSSAHLLDLVTDQVSPTLSTQGNSDTTKLPSTLQVRSYQKYKNLQDKVIKSMNLLSHLLCPNPFYLLGLKISVFVSI